MEQKIRTLIAARKGNFHRPLQSISEFSRWLELLAKIDAKIGMEIGVKHGGSAHWTLNCLPGIELYIGVDRHANRRSSALERHESVRLVHQDSTSEECLDAVKALLDGRKLDFLFIDGCHDAMHVLSDWIMYHGLVRSGGFVGFHDINFLPRVAESFRKIKDSGQWSEAIIADNTLEEFHNDFPPSALKFSRRGKNNKGKGFGIGVVCVS